MKYKIVVLLSLCSIIVSCEKITNVKVIDSASTGKLNYQIVDDSGKGVSGIKVSVYNDGVTGSGTYHAPGAFIDTLRTDKDGIAVFSKLIPANYSVETDSVTVNKVMYNTHEFVQVVAGLEKKRVTKASEFSGTLNITLKSNLNYSTPLSNMGIAAVPYPLNLTSDNITNIVNAAIITGVTNEKGFVALRIPSDRIYTFVVYSLNKGAIGYGYDTRSVTKDGSTSVQLYMSPINQ